MSLQKTIELEGGLIAENAYIRANIMSIQKIHRIKLDENGQPNCAEGTETKQLIIDGVPQFEQLKIDGVMVNDLDNLIMDPLSGDCEIESVWCTHVVTETFVNKDATKPIKGVTHSSFTIVTPLSSDIGADPISWAYSKLKELPLFKGAIDV